MSDLRPVQIEESSRLTYREQAPSLISAITGTEGWQHYNLPVNDTLRLRQIVEEHWIDGLTRHAPELVRDFQALGMERYHELSDKISHATMWPKLNRILPNHYVTEIRSMAFFEGLEEAFGPIVISDEENVGWEEIYWRLVRPNEAKDIGPVHADSWFWIVGNKPTPPDKVRVKIWIPLFCEKGLNGLKISPGSHFKTYNFRGEYRDGMTKPMLDGTDETLGMKLLSTQPGDAVVFNDNLLHGGAINRGSKTRVSCEFTMFIDQVRFDETLLR